MKKYDAVVIGSGPNGLSAAIQLLQSGRTVLVIEGRDIAGGGARSSELTLPGFIHDHCSAIHPMAVASPFFRSIPLEKFGLEWVYPKAAVAHPMDNSDSILVYPSIEETAEQLGKDEDAYIKFFKPLAANWQKLVHDFLGPLPLPPKYLLPAVRFGIPALLPATVLSNRLFQQSSAKALFAGMAAHSILPLDNIASSAVAIMLNTLAHAVNWPFPKNGAQSLTDAMIGYILSLGGALETGQWITNLNQIPPCTAIYFDTSPQMVINLVAEHLPSGYLSQLRKYRYGPGVCKVDFALSEPVPWLDSRINDAATVHLGGTIEEIAIGEKAVWQSRHHDRPYVLCAQNSVFDSTRALKGKHTFLAYCHVPNGSDLDVSSVIEKQIERFAPGFRDVVLAKNVVTAQQMQAYNPNYIGGDINNGALNISQVFTRPAVRFNPYEIPTRNSEKLPKMYICSSATPPGGGVHGMAGYHAVKSSLS